MNDWTLIYKRKLQNAYFDKDEIRNHLEIIVEKLNNTLGDEFGKVELDSQDIYLPNDTYIRYEISRFDMVFTKYVAGKQTGTQVIIRYEDGGYKVNKFIDEIIYGDCDQDLIEQVLQYILILCK